MPIEACGGGNRNQVTDNSFLDHAERVTLCEVLDRVLNKGVVVAGEVTISVADVDLVYLGLQAVLTSVETAYESFRLEPKGGWAHD